MDEKGFDPEEIQRIVDITNPNGDWRTRYGISDLNKYSYSSYNIANYSGPTQGHRSDGCLLVCDTVLGKHYHSNISTDDARRHNDGAYDSVAAGTGASMGIGNRLKEYECAVRRSNQVFPKYIVDCGGRVR